MLVEVEAITISSLEYYSRAALCSSKGLAQALNFKNYNRETLSAVIKIQWCFFTTLM